MPMVSPEGTPQEYEARVTDSIERSQKIGKIIVLLHQLSSEELDEVLEDIGEIVGEEEE